MPARPGKAKSSPKAFDQAIRAVGTKGLTQAALAEKAGLHVTYLSGVENGQRTPTLTLVSQFAQALDLKLPELVARAEQQQ